MRIALFTDGIWPFVIGGMQKHSYYLCKYLARNNIRVDLYHTHKSGGEIDLAPYFTAEEMNYIQSFVVPWPPPTDRFPGHYVRTSYVYSKRISEVFLKNHQQHPVHLVYAQGLTGRQLLNEKKSGKQLPFIFINVHGYEYYQQPPNFKARIEQFLLRPAFKSINVRADGIYSLGGKISDIIRRRIPGGADKMMEIPIGIDREFLIERPLVVNKVRKFAFVGRYERRKGIEELTGCIVQLIKDGVEFQFHFIGNIPAGKKIDSNKVFYHGVITEKEHMKKLLQETDVLVCPSHAEGMPTVILEGMASGCAIIATNVGAISVQVNGASGWLISPGNRQELKATMKKVIHLPDMELLKRKQTALRQVEQSFLWDDVIHQVIASFGRV